MEYGQAISDAGLVPPMCVDVPTDEDLIRSIAKRDRRAMLLLFARHKLHTFRFLLRIVDDQAEDLLNEVFLEVWRTANRFDARSRVRTWILSIARSKARSALPQCSLAALDDEAVESIEVMDLIYYHEQSVEEVARIIGVPESTVRTRVFHARKRLADLRAAQDVEPACL